MKKGRVFSRWLSFVLVFTLVIGLVQLPFPERVRANGRSTSLEMDYVNQMIHCSILLENEDTYDYAYFVGSFNDWNQGGKQAKYKLEWQGNGADRKLKLSLPMTNENIKGGFGNKEYKYMLHKKGFHGDDDSNFDWVTSSGYDGGNASFHWMNLRIDSLACETKPETNEVVFTVKSEGFDKVSVHGGFGDNKGWETHELTHKDGMVADTKTLAFPMGKRATGDYQYLFKLEKTGIETIWINGSYEKNKNSSFHWTTAFEITKLSHQVLVNQKKVRFEAEARGYEQVRVGYQKQGESNWENIPMIKDSTEDIFTLDLPMDGKSNGTYEFKFSLLPKGGNPGEESAWEWYKENKEGGDGNSSFNWNPPEDPTVPVEETADFTIKTSSDFVSLSNPVEFLAVKIDDKKNIDLVDDVVWSLEKEIVGVTLGNDSISIDSTVMEGTEINLKAHRRNEATKVAKKKFVVMNQATYTDKVLLHFLKQDKHYNGWNLWVFPYDDGDKQVDFLTGSDSDLGKIAFVDGGKNVIVRRKEGGNDWAEQTKSYPIPADAKDVYLIKDDNTIYTSLKEALLKSGPRIQAAIMDSKNSIKAYLTEAPQSEVNFELYANGVKVENITTNVSDKTVTFNTSRLSFDPRMLYEVKADNTFRTHCEVTKRLVLNDYQYDGDMGVKYDGDSVNFRIWAPTAHAAELLLYDRDDIDRASPSQVISLNHDTTSGTYYIAENKSVVSNKYYLYRFTFKTRDTAGEVGERQTYAVDPYAIATGLNGKKGYVTDINDARLKPEGWENDTKPVLKNPEDSIIYEMHVRDFTIADSWNGTPANRGKFLGVAETGTTYTDGSETVKTGLDHLVELGVTHVHLLPVYDIASIEEDGSHEFNAKKKNGKDNNRNWGYDPQNYNALEGSYATNPSNPTEVIKEFRTMVQTLHKKGIRVVLDKVYNHMYSTENMDNIVPGYYFRTDDLGKYTDGAGCGNEVATERPMVSKFIVDSNKMWLNNYKVDGLRFDLMALIDKDTMNKVQSEAKRIDKSIIVYGEPWKAFTPTPLPEEKQTKKGNTGIGAFNDTYREALRGNNGNSEGFVSKGFVQGSISLDNSGKVRSGLRGSHEGLGYGNTVSDPELMINYVEAHDNYAIFDQIERSENNDISTDGYRSDLDSNAWKMDKALLANGFVLTSQGIPFFQGGSEILRTKKGDHNSYKSDDTTNAIHWEDKVTYKKAFDYYKNLIKIRKEHPAFRLTSVTDINNHQKVDQLMYRDDLIYNHLKNNAGGDKWKNIVVIYNGSTNNVDVTWLPKVPSSKWKLLFDKGGYHEDNLKEITQKADGNLNAALTLPASSLMILFDEEGRADDIRWEYLFADQSIDYMDPLEPTATEPVKVRFRAAVGDVKEAKVHYYDEADSRHKEVNMTKLTDASFYQNKGYDSSKIEFWEGTIPASNSRKYYNFEVKNGTKSAWISGGRGGNNRGVTESKPMSNGSPDYGFWIVPDYKTPNWAKEAVFYQIMVDRFRDGDSSNNRVAKDVSQFGNPSEISKWGTEIFNGNESDKIWNNQFFGGDLIGVKEALPYLNYLGVTSLYLMPIFQSGSDHKYDTDDYKYVDKNFGGNKALADLRTAMTSKGMKLVLDGVFNHTSTEGELFKKHKKDYYFYGEKEYKDGNGTPIDFYAWHGFTNLAKLNYSKDEVKKLIYKDENSVAKHYLKAPYSIDGWRLDAAEDVNTKPRDYVFNDKLDKSGIQNDKEQREANLAIWKEFREAVKDTKEDAFILGEFWKDDNQWYKERAWDSKMNYGGFMMPYINNNGINHYFGDAHSLDNKNGLSVADIGKYTRDYFKKFPYQTILSGTNSISTHDQPRFLNREFAGKDNAAMMQLAAALQMTYPGIPMIYYGDEIGTRGKNGSSDKKEWGKDPYNRDTFNWDVTTWNAASKQMFKDHKTLIETRKKNKDAFVYGAFEEIASHNTNQYIAYARYGKNNRTITILNNHDGQGNQNITLTKLERYGFKDNDVLHDVISNQSVTISDGEASFPSQNMTASVWVLEGKKPIVTNDIQFTLEEASDSRSKLPTVNNAKLSVSGNEISVDWEAYQAEGTKEISVGIYDGNKRFVEKTVSFNETKVVFTKEYGYPSDFSVEIKVLADRSKKIDGAVTDDGYMDSDFVSLIHKSAPIGGGILIPDNILPPSEKKEEKEEERKETPKKTEKTEEETENKTKKVEQDKKEEEKNRNNEGSLSPSVKAIISYPIEEVIFVEKENKTSASIPTEALTKVLSGEASEIVIEVKDGLIALGKAPLERLISKNTKKLQVEVKIHPEKSKVAKKDLPKVGNSAILKKEVFSVSFIKNGKKLKKVELGKSKFTISLHAPLEKAPKTLYVMELATGKLIRAKYNKKNQKVIFKANKTGNYVLVTKKGNKKTQKK